MKLFDIFTGHLFRVKKIGAISKAESVKKTGTVKKIWVPKTSLKTSDNAENSAW